jgi:hypothetical protein
MRKVRACRVVFAVTEANMPSVRRTSDEKRANRFVMLRFTDKGREYAAQISRKGNGKVGRYTVHRISAVVPGRGLPVILPTEARYHRLKAAALLTASGGEWVA